jgi:glycosyltransferase involved in cell wall biosynthesis
VKIIVYDDTLDFGGHQIMACHGIEALAVDPANEIICMIHPGNLRLAEKLKKINSCRILETPCLSRRFRGGPNPIDRRGITKLRHLFKTLQADLLLCIQGDIEHSSRALAAAQGSGLECISYIALPHRLSHMGARFGAWRDSLNSGLFARPSRYIAISERMAGLLRQRGVTQPVTVVPNGISMPPMDTAANHARSQIENEDGVEQTLTDSHSAPAARPRKRLTVLGMLGRIEFKQKQQDFMVKAFCDFPSAFEDCRLLIAGDGPDRCKLEQLVLNVPRTADIELLPWQPDIEAFFASIDLLVIPSRFEGVPLVMLEALARGIPVIGSNRDGMEELLPESWTFEAENAAALADTFSSVGDTWQQMMDPLRQKILNEHSLEAFKAGFCAAVLQD